MGAKITLALLLVGMTGMLTAPGAVAQTAGQDSVTLSGTGSAGEFSVSVLEATSGPSGENPTGQVAFLVFGSISVGGPVTCLAVSGNDATLNIQDARLGVVTVEVQDGPDTFAASPQGRAPGNCSPLPTFPPVLYGGPLTGGDITVVDAPPLPTSKEQCKDDAWQTFGFKNRGACVAFVQRWSKP